MLSDKCVFVHLELGLRLCHIFPVVYGGSQALEVLEAKRSYVGSQPASMIDPQRNAGHKGLGKLLWLAIFCTCCHTSLLKIVSAVCVAILREN